MSAHEKAWTKAKKLLGEPTDTASEKVKRKASAGLFDRLYDEAEHRAKLT